jgi:hypothetical protein
MAKTITEQLLALLPEGERAAFKAKLDANPKLVAQDVKTTEIYSIYQGEEVETEPVAAPVTPVVVAPVTPVAVAPVTPVNPVAAGGNDAILAELRNLSTSLDTKLAAFEAKFVPAAKLPEYRGEITAIAIKAADDMAQIRESHRAEFDKPLDRDAFEKYVTDQQAAGTKFKDLKQAHDMFVTTERTAADVAKQVADQVKQKTSATTVPGQTQSIGLSPAQAVLKKARESAKGGDGKSNAMAAAEKLAALDRANEERNAGVVQ